MLKEAIILAGGFGTRLKEVVSDVPKPMAPVVNLPFLSYLLRYLKHYGISKAIISTGYLAESINAFFKNEYSGITIEYSHEHTPLGTGGGIRLAMEKCHSKNILVLNGDSFFDINLNAFYNSHCSFHSDCTLALRELTDTARYGTIKLGSMNQLKSFREKNNLNEPGLINGGVYLLKKEIFLKKNDSEQNFSIEKDFFERKINELNIFGFPFPGYFIDIGIPTDYKKAQDDFKRFEY